MQICLDMRTGAGCGTENPNYVRQCSTCGKPLRFALTLLDPKTLVGRYDIVGVIGYGAYGAVYEAHKRKAQPVALKETFDASSITTFEREFKVLSGLQHPNLPRYIDMFEATGNGYLVMEYVPGQSLQEILDHETELLPSSQVLGYALQLCDVLEYLHSQQPAILHRDIKPANIRLTPEGRIKLVDFGLLKQGGYQTRATIRGLGTPAYAPLEQYGDNQQVTDVRSDIYSLGATLYHLFSGQEPLSAPNRLAGDSDPLPPLPVTRAQNVKETVMKAISLMPRDRFASISHFRQALVGVQSVEADLTKAPEPATQKPLPAVQNPMPKLSSASDSTAAHSQATSMQSLVQLLPLFLKRTRLVFRIILITIVAITFFRLSGLGMSPESEPIALPLATIAVVKETKTATPVVEETKTTTPVLEETNTPTIESTASPQPRTTVAVVKHTKTPKTEELAAGEGSTAGAMACFGTFGFGITCLDQSGWRSFNEDNSPLSSDLIGDMAVCPDNRLLIAHTFGVSAFDGQTWAKYEAGWDHLSPNAIACDANGGLWAAHYEGVSYFDGKSWSTTPSSQLATGNDATDLVEDVTIGPDGRVWVSTAHTIATTSDGKAWTVYQQGQGFNEQYFLESVAVDSQGGVWADYSGGLLHFDGTKWTTHQDSDFISVETLAVDDDGNVWVGTFSDGLKLFNGQDWRTYDTQNSGLISNHVSSLAIDAQGRVWIGTDWGISLFDGLDWQTYQMDSADLADNEIRTLAVRGGASALPEATDKENGSLIGQLLKHNKEPIAEAEVELCAPDSNSYSSGRPCKGQPLILQTTTDADGNFVITDIPVGRVVLTINIAGGKWIELEDDDGIGQERILINPGQETDLSILIIDEEEN